MVSAVLFNGCASSRSPFGPSLIEESEQAVREGRHEAGLALLEKEASDSPDDIKLRATIARQRAQSANQLSATGEQARRDGKLEAAEQHFHRALAIEPGHVRSTQGLAQLGIDQRHLVLIQEATAAIKKGEHALAQSLLRTVLAQAPNNLEAKRLLANIEEARLAPQPAAKTVNSAFAKPVTLEFRDAPLKTVFEVLSRSSGVNFVFDRDVKADAKVTIFVRNTMLDEVIRLILSTNQLEKRALNENAFLIYPNTPAKAKDYQELALRTFFLSNADAKQVQAMLKTVLKSRDIHIDEKLNMLVLRDTPQAIELAEKLVASVDISEPEVMLELEVLEVNRSRLGEFGLRFPDQVGYGKITPDVVTNVLSSSGSVISQTTTFGGALATGYIDTRSSTGLTSYVSNPGVTLNLRNELGDSNLLANPRIRVRNREKAKIHIGDKLPVFTTTSTANVGVSASVSYLDVGLKLEVEPQIYLEDDVSIKVGLEVSSVTKEVTGPEKSLAYQIGSRTTNTVLRLRNGETQVLAGLISDEERSSANRLPGLGSLPVVGRLFGSQRDQHNKTEIILLITPRVVRNIVPPDTVRSIIPAGTENVVGAAPLTVRNSAPRSLSIAPTAAGSASAASASAFVPSAPTPSEPATEAANATPAATPAPAATAAESAPAAAAETVVPSGTPPPAAGTSTAPAPAARIIGGPPPTLSTESSVTSVTAGTSTDK